MKLELSKPIVENILNVVINFTEKRDNSAITSHILIEANEGEIKFKATDKEFGVIYKDKSSKIIEQGKVTINGKRFYEIIKALNEDSIKLYTEENKIIISQQHSIYKLPTFEAKEFPEFPEIEETEKIKVDEEKFIDGLKKVFPVIDTNNPKYELNGALLDIDENYLNLVATDTKRLALISINQNKEKETQIIIPKKSIAEIKKLFFNNFEIFYDGIYLLIKSKNITFFTKLINGKFPDYKRIIPTEYRFIIEVNKNEFLKALKKINIISQEVKIEIKKDKIEFESISNETFEAKTDIQITTDIENFTFAVNSKFIVDFLNSIEENSFELCLNDENIPFTLKNKNFQTIIMPITI